jgi:hypothetical protein
MNLRDYPTLHLDTNSVKEHQLYCCSTFQCHSRDYNNEQNSYPTKFTENVFFFFIICYKITIYANERQSEIERERERRT